MARARARARAMQWFTPVSPKQQSSATARFDAVYHPLSASGQMTRPVKHRAAAWCRLYGFGVHSSPGGTSLSCFVGANLTASGGCRRSTNPYTGLATSWTTTYSLVSFPEHTDCQDMQQALLACLILDCTIVNRQGRANIVRLLDSI